VRSPPGTASSGRKADRSAIGINRKYPNAPRPAQPATDLMLLQCNSTAASRGNLLWIERWHRGDADQTPDLVGCSY
jgi:hypothetical protein